MSLTAVVLRWGMRYLIALLLLALNLVQPPVALGQAAPVQIPPPVPLRIMPLGDSITRGLAPGGIVENVDGYRANLYRLLRASGVAFDFVGTQHDTFGGLPDADHEGHNGYTVKLADEHIAEWMATSRPNVILLMLGTNDMNDSAPFPAAAAPGAMRSLLAHIQAIDPTVLTLVSTIPPRWDYAPAAENTPIYNAALPVIVRERRVTGQRVRLVDVGGALTAADLADGVHPSFAGYDKLGALWYRQIRNPDRSIDPVFVPSGARATAID